MSKLAYAGYPPDTVAPLGHYSQMLRPATHAGSWYCRDKARLATQIADVLEATDGPVSGARVLLGPHAGYTFCGARLAETYAAWDTAGVQRVFILGPSHHVYFLEAAKVSAFLRYDTPLGSLPVDTDVCRELVGAADSAFAYMTAEEDEDEHLFEMHAPFIAYRSQADGVAVLIVPVMISGLLQQLKARVVAQLLPYMADPHNTFVVSSDFCHWGRRFGYTEYTPDADLALLGPYKRQTGQALHRSIEYLDRCAMDAAQAGSAEWDSYIAATGNTICGQKPVSIVLRLVEQYVAQGGRIGDGLLFQWLGYLQSSHAESLVDLSVSYASGYIRLP